MKSALYRILLLCCLAGAAQAGDEDMNPSIYQRFDPETGYMVPIDPPPQHNTPTTKAEAGTAQKEPQRQQAVDAGRGPAEQRTRSLLFWVAGAAGLLLLGAVLLKRNRTPWQTGAAGAGQTDRTHRAP